MIKKSALKVIKFLHKFIIKLLNNTKLVLFVIFLLGFVVRLYKIDNPIADWHSFRQADTASVTREYVKNGLNLLYPRYHDLSSIQSGFFNPEGYRFVEFPIFNALHYFLTVNFSFFSLEVWGRLVSIFSALITAGAIYVIGKKLIGKEVGILSAFFYLFLPFNIYFTRVILPEPMAVMFGVLAILFFVFYIEGEKKKFLYTSAVFFALGMLLKPFIFFYAFPMFFLLHKKYDLRKVVKNAGILIPLLVAAGIAVFPFFAWRIWINKYPSGIPLFKWAFNGDDIRFKPSFFRWIFTERLSNLILGGWGLIPFTAGIWLAKKGRKFVNFFLLGMLFYVTVFATANVKHDYYQTIVMPAISLALGLGTWYMWNRKKRRLTSRILVVFSIMVMFISSAVQIKEFYKVNHPEIITAGAAVERLTPEDAIIIAPYNGDTAFLYQTNRRGWPYVDREVEQLIKRGAEYYVSVDFSDANLLKIIDKYEVVEETKQYIILDLGRKK